MASLILDYSLAEQTITKNYIFKDIAMDMEVDDYKRDIKDSLDINAIQNGINNIFMFLPGERVLLPEFGNNLYKYLYEPISDITAERLGGEIKSSFEKWEPRVTIQNIYIEPDAENNTYNVEVIYTIPSVDMNKTLSFTKAINIRR